MNMSGNEDAADEEFTIVVEGKSLTCQKHTLREKSEYFRAMFDSHMVESQANTVTLQDQDYSIVSNLVEFMRTGELKMNLGTQNMKMLTEAAVMLQIEDALKSCTEYWRSTLNHETCLSLMAYSRSFNLGQLFNYAKRHALYYFNDVIKSSDFVKTDCKELVNYLSSPDLNCTSEIEILDAVLKWYSFDKRGRKSLLKEFLPCFHGDDVCEDKRELVKNHELVRESKEWQTYIDSTQQTDGTTKIKEKFRQQPVVFLTFGGYDSNDQPCTDICKFDESSETFKPVLNLKDVYADVGDKMGYQVTLVGKDIYLSGGQLYMKRYSMILDVWKLDGFDLTWHKATKLTTPRRHHGACGSDNSLYIMGGFGKYRDILDTLQQYDAIKDEWTDLTRMPHAWFTPQAVYCDNKILVYKTFLICLDLRTLDWTTIRKTPSSSDNMMSPFPQYFDEYVYEFPFFDTELDWLYEFEVGRCSVQKMCVETRQVEEIEDADGIPFGNKCVVCNEKFYLLSRDTNAFLSGFLKDFSTCKKLGTGGKAGYCCVVVAVPHYPIYKIKL